MIVVFIDSQEDTAIVGGFHQFQLFRIGVFGREMIPFYMFASVNH